MRRFLLPALLVASAPLHAQPTDQALEVVIESRVEGDLNTDGIPDSATVAHNEDARALSVMLSNKKFGGQFTTEVLLLEPSPVGPGTLSIEGNVLKFEDLTGGTTAIGSTRRFRYDATRKRMRLIGLDATLYSRTNAHDGFEMSWNLINGDTVTHELRLVEGAGEDPYELVRERRFKRRIRPQWLSDAPDPETTLEEMRQD